MDQVDGQIVISAGVLEGLIPESELKVTFTGIPHESVYTLLEREKRKATFEGTLMATKTLDNVSPDSFGKKEDRIKVIFDLGGTDIRGFL